MTHSTADHTFHLETVFLWHPYSFSLAVLASWLLPFSSLHPVLFLCLFFKCQGPQASGLVFPSPFHILWWHHPALYPLLFIPVDTKPKVYMKWLQLSFVFLFSTELPNLIGRLMIWPEGYAMVRNRSAILWQEKSIQIQPTLIVNCTYYGLELLPYIGYVI